MKKKYLTLIPFIIGAACMVAYNIIGSEVAPDGTLLEPFYLIPMSYLFLAIGIILVPAVSIVSFSRNSKKN
ncbi:DUF3955 domain-containing protein [Clostridium sp. FP2]|uniref:DUF3955 domain-containing protein n=1 Tax=Clostridium TaxID=1485 RepID=UPI0013E8F92B|nr:MULTISPECIES: DUF3955 domain-containing protein [Clostridium]MBW9158458.1 DUF3955 domain-containing protein [Clostridium tagluense]MBZ9623147.1 DUF3955 domain-containing protein [Clostridium sp. FP2]WLC67321.1 DUF3955 domain-containing protein [Clostridium tagluense]